jgi:glycerate 2-kinase
VSDRPLRVVVAPDSFGGALASPGVADAIAAGWARARPSDVLDLAPMADGGEGTLEALGVALGDRAERRSVRTVDALGRPVSADWLLIDGGEAAFVEMASASGLARLAVDERTPANARVASSRGTGDLLGAALDAGAASITLGLGGSATTDGGSGMLVALGARLLDESGEELTPGGAALAQLARIDASALDPRLDEVAMTVASDVTNRLCGPAGAAATYGPQKGCDEWAVQELDRALLHWGRAVEQATGRSVADQPGAGAAGGTTSALLGFTNAVIRPGVDVVAEAVGLADLLAAADLVITGEGQADEQTLSGKAAMGVAALARGNATRVVLLCGGLGPGAAALDASGAFAVVQPIADRPMRLAASMRDTERLLANAAERVARTVQVGLLLAEPGA